MNTDQVGTFFALLAIIAGAGALGVLALTLAWRGTERLAELRSTQWHTAMLAASIVAFASTLGSLYLSEVAHFTPCNMCWYQRIAMYPIGPLLLVAWFRRDTAIKLYMLSLACAGALISTYHVLIEIFPSLESSTTCGAIVSCTTSPITPLGGAFSVPRMALCGFAAIIAALSLVPATQAVQPD